MAINTINGGYTPPVRGGYPERAGPSNVASLPDKPVKEVDQVQLTPGSMSLRQLQTERQEPPIDEAKVASLRKAIAEGGYQVDSSRLAGKMSDFEATLFP
ncbi:MAG: flagellar biosynthesis anti-sigma factor FlgM [Candidatus Competibacteraceae bacterium]|nr:flagellar biosynthesis anti-sigma factor FlgM [Candidatus Competibacteraceae bacterium]